MINQSQIRHLMTDDETSLASIRGDNNKVIYVKSEQAFYNHVVDNTLVAIAGQVVSSTVTDGFWVRKKDASALTELVVQATHGFNVLQPVYHDGTDWKASQGDLGEKVAQAIVTKVIDGSHFIVTTHGVAEVTAHGLTAGEYYWLDQASSAVVDTKQTSGIVQGLLHVRDANTIFVDVEQAVEVGEVAAGGLAQKGVVVASIAEQGIYTAEGTDTATTLYAATGSQDRVMVTSTATHSDTVFSVQSGEKLNGVVDATYTTQAEGELLLFMDSGVGEWTVQVLGEGSLKALSYGMNTSITGGQSTNSSTYSDIVGSEITLVNEGTYDITAVLRARNSLTQNSNFKFVDGSGADIPSSSEDWYPKISNATESVVIKFQYKTTGNETIKMQFASHGGSTTTVYNTTATSAGNTGHSTITWNQIPETETVLAGMVEVEDFETVLMPKTAYTDNVNLTLPSGTWNDIAADYESMEFRLWNSADTQQLQSAIVTVSDILNSMEVVAFRGNDYQNVIRFTSPTTDGLFRVDTQGAVSQNGQVEVIARKKLKTVVPPNLVEVEDLSDVLFNNPITNGGSYNLNNGLTWQQAKDTYEFIEFSYITNQNHFPTGRIDTANLFTIDTDSNENFSYGMTKDFNTEFSSIQPTDGQFTVTLGIAGTSRNLLIKGIKPRKTVIDTTTVVPEDLVDVLYDGSNTSGTMTLDVAKTWGDIKSEYETVSFQHWTTGEIYDTVTIDTAALYNPDSTPTVVSVTNASTNLIFYPGASTASTFTSSPTSGFVRITGKKKQKTIISDSGYSYATDERQTDRTWHNGKPIFERTFIFTTVAANGDHNIDTLTNYEDLVSVEGFVEDSSNRKYIAGVSFDTTYFAPHIASNNLRYSVSGAALGNRPATVTVRYTKV